MILHILHTEDWQYAIEKGQYSPSSLQSEGFIHCAATEQVVEIANLFFKGTTNLKILCIAPEKVKAKIVYEDTENFGQVFPHIYGILNLDCVVKVVDFTQDPNGKFIFPTEINEVEI